MPGTGSKKKAHRFARLSKEAHPPQQKADDQTRVVSFAAAQAKLHQGVRHGVSEDGSPKLTVAFPPDEKGRDREIDLSYLLELPYLAEPIAEAFYQWGMRVSSRSRVGSYLKHGFFQYLVEQGLQEINLGDLDTARYNNFINWINSLTDISETSRGLRLTWVRNLVEQWRAIPRYAAQLPDEWQVPTHVWTGKHRRVKPTEVLTEDVRDALLDICAEEITATIERLEYGWRLMAENADSVPEVPKSYSSYQDFGICLAALNRYYPALLPSHALMTQEHSKLESAIDSFHGGLRAVRSYFYPSARELIPFLLMITLQTGFNPETILSLKLSEIIDDELLGAPVQRLNPQKLRAADRPSREFPVVDEVDNPPYLLAFIKRWTTRLRPLVDPLSCDDVFLFVGARGRRRKWGSFARPVGKSDGLVAHTFALSTFIKKHSLPPFTLRNIRMTTLDAVHELSGGDLRAVQAIGGQKRPDTINSHYTSDAARKRNDERLSQVMNLRERWHETDGRMDSRKEPERQDKGAATPGWTCLDPYSSPMPAEVHGRACRAYGACPACPLAAIDTQSEYALGRALQLRQAIQDAQAAVPAQRWLATWAERLERLNNHWLPMFTCVEVIEAAKQLRLPPLAPLE